MGTVMDVYAFADVGHTYGEQTPTYRCVPTSLLFPASEWRFELLVSRNGWIGSVSTFFWRLKVQLKDSNTVLTIDTRTVKRHPEALSRVESPVLKATPSEGTFLVGTTLAISLHSVIEAVEGEVEWQEAVKARVSVPTIFDPTIPASNARDYAYGTVIAMEISSVQVAWADHANGCSIGDTRPLTHQRASDITIVDPFYHNSLARYELTWVTPDVRAFEAQEYFVFPDGTRVHSSTMEFSPPPVPATPHSLSSSIDASTTSNLANTHKDGAETASQTLSSSSHSSPLPGDVVPPLVYFSAGRGCKYAHHPDPSKCTTMNGQIERKLSQRDVDRQLSLNAPHVQHSGVGYQLDDVAYVKQMCSGKMERYRKSCSRQISSPTCTLAIQTSSHLTTCILCLLLWKTTRWRGEVYCNRWIMRIALRPFGGFVTITSSLTFRFTCLTMPNLTITTELATL